MARQRTRRTSLTSSRSSYSTYSETQIPTIVAVRQECSWRARSGRFWSGLAAARVTRTHVRL